MYIMDIEQNNFEQFGLCEQVLRAVKQEKYTSPTPIQQRAIPHLMEGRDLIGCAQTGTGKTAAFALPLLHHLAVFPERTTPKGAKILVLTPTRELAGQVGQSFSTYGKYLRLRHALVYGGVSQNPQVRAMSRGVDILVATPGRLLDLINQRHITLSQVKTLVLDEADRMLDMGFLPDIKRIIALIPQQRQSLLFSATMSHEIMRLAEQLLSNPVKISISPATNTTSKITENLHFVDERNKYPLLLRVLQRVDCQRTLVFTRTKHGANRLATKLNNEGCPATAIHGNKSQSARNAALQQFRNGVCKVMVATDVAARGIDVDDITHVVNFDLPNEPESYIHRIGRTGRAGSSGVAISMCGEEDRYFLRNIERLLKHKLPICTDHPYHVKHTGPISAPSRGKWPRRAAKPVHRPRHNRRPGSHHSNRTSRP